jgi:hypothetical protein
MTGYDDYDPHSTENEPDWFDWTGVKRVPEYQPDEEPPAEWIGWAKEGPDNDDTQ